VKGLGADSHKSYYGTYARIDPAAWPPCDACAIAAATLRRIGKRGLRLLAELSRRGHEATAIARPSRPKAARSLTSYARTRSSIGRSCRRPWSSPPASAPVSFGWARIRLLTNDTGSHISSEDYGIAAVDELEKPTHIRSGVQSAIGQIGQGEALPLLSASAINSRQTFGDAGGVAPYFARDPPSGPTCGQSETRSPALARNVAASSHSSAIEFRQSRLLSLQDAPPSLPGLLATN
jgi:hypothetical protein